MRRNATGSRRRWRRKGARRIWTVQPVRAALVGGAIGLVLGAGLHTAVVRRASTLLAALLLTSAASRLLGSHASGRLLPELADAAWASLCFGLLAALLFALERAREAARERGAATAASVRTSVAPQAPAAAAPPVEARFQRIDLPSTK